MPQDRMEIEILADGSIRVTTDKISGANHMAAEAIAKYIAEKSGGEVIRERKGHAHSHEHAHEHQHEHEHATTGGGKK